MSTPLHAPDLTKHAPRSGRVRLGGYALLPRMLDKGRASIAGTNGDYHYDCPLDQQFISFVGIDATKLREQLALGLGDGEILEWIKANATHQRHPYEIAQWSAYMESRVPGDVETKEFFTKEVAKLTKTRDDILTWMDWLDLDDYVTYGGKA